MNLNNNRERERDLNRSVLENLPLELVLLGSHNSVHFFPSLEHHETRHSLNSELLRHILHHHHHRNNNNIRLESHKTQ